MLLSREDGKYTSSIASTVLVQAPGHQIVETHPHSMQRWLVVVATGLRDISMYYPFTLLVINWLETANTLPERMTIAHNTAALDILRAMTIQGDSVNITQQYKAAETEEQKSERHYAGAKQNDSDNENLIKSSLAKSIINGCRRF